ALYARDRARARASRLADAVWVARHSRRRTVRVLVTGATGFTGGHLARALAAHGREVRAFVRDAGRARALERSGIELIADDIRDESALDRAVAGVELVYHIAAVYRQAGIP